MNKENFFKNIRPFYFGVVFLIFVLNFMGSPLIKWTYLIQVSFTLIIVILFPLRNSMIFLLPLFFTEGQGRIVWQYAGWARVIFDSLILIGGLKVFINTRSFYPRDKIPQYIGFAILLHFIWYIFQFFNIYNVGAFAVLAAAKIYIIPFIVFFTFLKINISEDPKVMDELTWITLFMLIGECALSIYQMNFREDLLLKISSFYQLPLRGDAFVGILFRPFGTAHVAGVISVYIFLTQSFLYLSSRTGPIFKFLNILLTLLSLFTLFISQVRSALVKYFLMFLLIQVGVFLIKKGKVLQMIKAGFYLFILMSVIIYFSENMKQYFPDMELDVAMDRLTQLENVNEAKSQRISISEWLHVMEEKLTQTPLGLGPGRTGAASSVATDKIANDPIYGPSASWTHDNFFISLAIDFGLGAFFYMFVIFSIPITLVISFWRYRKIANEQQLRLLMVSSITLIVILIGNWGAIGLTYNPESFIFWLWSGMGLNTLYKIKESYEL